MPKGIYDHKPNTVTRNRKISAALKGRKLSKSHVENIRRSKLGELNYAWKGEEASYGAKHDWVRRKLGTPSECEHCGSKDKKRYEWANKDGLYRRNLNDWIRLCMSCHNKYDNIARKGWATRRSNVMNRVQK